MIIKEIKNGVEISEIENFNLQETFECGQCFRWENIDNKYCGIAYNRFISLYYDKRKLIIEGTNCDEANSIWRNYFDLDRDYSEIQKKLCKIDPILEKASKFCPGIRILNQDPWEGLCSFIISQNNNIPRIKKIISSLCCEFGDKIAENMFSFPTAERLSMLTLDDLAIIRSGFRSKYILDAAQKVANKDVDLVKVAHMPIDEARKALMKIKGVGKKVSECTLLYGFHRLEAFPIDIWMKRVMTEFFPNKSPDFFGEYAGIAQQYLFHYIRNKN